MNNQTNFTTLVSPNTILEGTVKEGIRNRAKEAKFDERLALLGLILDTVMEELKVVNREEKTQLELLEILKKVELFLLSMVKT